MGVEYQTINRIENGVYFTNYANLEKLSKIFNVTVDELFNYSHIKMKTKLIQEINEILEEAPQNKVEMIYKIIRMLH